MCNVTQPIFRKKPYNRVNRIHFGRHIQLVGWLNNNAMHKKEGINGWGEVVGYLFDPSASQSEDVGTAGSESSKAILRYVFVPRHIQIFQIATAVPSQQPIIRIHSIRTDDTAQMRPQRHFHGLSI